MAPKIQNSPKKEDGIKNEEDLKNEDDNFSFGYGYPSQGHHIQQWYICRFAQFLKIASIL